MIKYFLSLILLFPLISNAQSQFRKDRDSAVKYYKLMRICVETGKKNEAGIIMIDPKYDSYNVNYLLYRNKALTNFHTYADSNRFLKSFADSLDTYKLHRKH